MISAEHCFRLIAAHFTATASTLILAECSALLRQVVWERGTKFAGGNEAKGAQYDLVQVMDAQGKKLQPAYDEWQAYCDSAEQGSSSPVDILKTR